MSDQNYDAAEVQKKLDLARKLLAKAESTTPEEAIALTEAATKIIMRYGITEAMLNAKPGEKVNMIQGWITFEGTYADGLLTGIYQALAEFNTCFFTRHRSAYNKTVRLNISGRDSQVRQMEVIGRSLELQAMAAMKAWWKEEKDSYWLYTEHQKRMARRSFLISFGRGAASRIRDEREVAEVEMPGSALVLASEAARAEEWVMGQLDGKLRNARGLKSNGNAAGYRAGQRADVGTTGVDSGASRAISS